MPEPWAYREEPPAAQHPRTERVPWSPQQYSQTEHISQLGPRLPPPPPADQADPWAASQAAFTPVTRPPQRQYRPAAPAAPSYHAPRPMARYQAPRPSALHKTSLTAAEQFWYIIGNISFGAMYLAKIPGKKALADFGLAEMTAAEKFWYVLMCFPFGAGYLAKVPFAKAVAEMQRQQPGR